MKIKAPQFELPEIGSEAFNLVVEQAEDGEQVRRETEAAEQVRREAREIEKKRQRNLV